MFGVSSLRRLEQMMMSQTVVHVMTSLQPWFSVQSIVHAALNTNPRVFVTYR